MGRIDLVAVIASALLLGYIIESVRRRRLREEYSILWLATATVLLLLSLVRPALNFLARALGIISPVNALFVVGFAFTTIILLHFSTVISRLSRENRQLAQRYALLVHGLQQEDSEAGAEPTNGAIPTDAHQAIVEQGNEGQLVAPPSIRCDRDSGEIGGRIRSAVPPKL